MAPSSRKPKDVPTQRDIARRLGLDVSTVNKILRNAPGPAFSKDASHKVWEMAETLGYDLERLRHQHHRGYERVYGSRPVTVVLYRKDGSVMDKGTSILVELSRSGARLDRVHLSFELVPFEESGIGIRFPDGKPEELRGRLARVIAARRGTGMAVMFKSLIPPATVDAALPR